MIYSFVSTDVTVSNTSTETAIFTVPVVASLMSVGRTIRTEFWGVYSATAIAPTITMRLRYGASIASSTVLGTATASALLSAASSAGFNAMTCSTIRAVGSSGSLFTQGKLSYEGAAGVQNGAWIKATSVVAVDLSVDTNIIATIQFSGANVSNVVRATNGMLSIE